MALAELRVIGSLFGGTWDIHRGDTAASGDPAEAGYSSFSLHAAESKPRKGSMQSTPVAQEERQCWSPVSSVVMMISS